MQYKSFQKSLGFSIIELIISISIMLLIGFTIWIFQKNIFSSNNTISGDVIAQNDVHRAFKEITSEIRSASFSSLGAYPIDNATTTSFIFYSDIDDDGVKERIRYFLDGTIFKKGTLKPSGNPLIYNPTNETISETIHDVDNGTTPIFNYYDTNYDGFTSSLTNPINILAIRLIKITVIIDHDPSKLPSPITFTTQVSIRSLKDNL